MAHLLINLTCGKENPEKATLPFIIGNAGRAADQEVTIFLTLDAVWLSTRGYADGIHHEGMVPLADLIGQFIQAGGKLRACGACTKTRAITAEQLLEGAKIVTADNLVEWMAAGASVLSF